jgi:hypothetical protein
MVQFLTKRTPTWSLGAALRAELRNSAAMDEKAAPRSTRLVPVVGPVGFTVCALL